MRRLAALLAVLATFAATATAEAKQLVRYDVGGGIAGISERLTVARDGTARQTGNRRGSDHRFSSRPSSCAACGATSSTRASRRSSAATAPRTWSTTASASP